MDEALVPHAQRLRFRRSNFRLLSDIKSKESTLQLVYDVLRICPFFKAFLVTSDGLYHKRNIDYSYLLWEDLVYQVEHKNTKKSNEMYYPQFTKVIIHYFMSKNPSIPRRNKVNSHYVRDDHMFSTIKLVSRHQNTQYPRLTASAKGKQIAKASKAKSLYALSEVAMTEAQQLKLVTKRSMQHMHISQASGSGADEGTGADNERKDGDDDEEAEGDDGKEGDGDDDDKDEVEREDDKDDKEEGGDDEHKFNEEEYDEETRDGESFDPIPQTPENSKDKGNGDDDLGLNGRGIQATLEVEDSHVTLTPVNPNGQHQSLSVSSQFVTSILNPTLDVGMESIFETKLQLDVQTPTFMAPLPMSAPTMTPSTITTTSQKIIKEQVKEQVKVQVSKILPRIEQAVNEQLEAEVLTRSSHSSKTSYAVADDLSEMELKKILIEKIEVNKSIQRLDEQRNLYKALVEAYESDEIILDTNGDTVTLKRRRDDDADKDEESSPGPDRGSKRRREGKEPESASAPTKNATRSAGRSTQGSRSRQASASVEDQPIVQSSQHLEWFSQQQKPPSSDCDWNKTVPAVYGSIQPWISELAKQTDSRSSFNKLMDTPLDFSIFLINRLKESARDVYSKRRIIAVTKLKIVEWHSYKHLDWITVRRDDDKLYKFKEGDFKRLRIQDIKDMLLLLVQGKLTNLTVEERFAFNVSLRMFTRSIVIQRRVEDLQLGVESYQKKLNLTKLDSYRSDLKRKEAYTANSNP
nr:hypothetical protein [Tanacetum cinerariifolium]